MKSLVLSIVALFTLMLCVVAQESVGVDGSWPKVADDETVGTLPVRVAGSHHASHMVTFGSKTVGIDIGDPSMYGGTIAAEVDPTAPAMTNTWQSGSMTMTVTTPRKKGENAEHQAQRHHQAVVALAQYFPPTTGGASPSQCVGLGATWTSGPYSVAVCVPGKMGTADLYQAAHALAAWFPAG